MNRPAVRLAGYDLGMLPFEWLILRRLRRHFIPHLNGDILEIGVGTGANLPWYPASARLTALDMDARMIHAVARHPRRHEIHVLRADAGQLPFAEATFDHIVGTLVFCTIPDPDAALQEIRRVLRPHGWLWLLEHVRGQTPLVRWLTDRLAAPWLRWTGSCHLDRNTAERVQRSGLRTVSVQSYLGGFLQMVIARHGEDR